MRQLDGFSCSLAQIIELCSSDLAASDGLYVENVRRMKRKDSLDAFAADYSTNSEVFIDSTASARYDGAAEYLSSDLFALFDSTVDIDNIPNLEVRDVILQALLLNGVQYFSLHEYISCVNTSYSASRQTKSGQVSYLAFALTIRKTTLYRVVGEKARIFWKSASLGVKSFSGR